MRITAKEANAVIKDDPKMPMAHMSLGYAYLNMKKWSEAISALKETIRLAPELAEAHHLLGLTYFGAGRKEDAMQEYAVLLNLNPNYAIQFKAEMDEDKDKKKNKKH